MKNIEIGSKALRRMIDNATDNCIARERKLRDEFIETNACCSAGVIQDRNNQMLDVVFGINQVKFELLRELERLEKLAG